MVCQSELIERRGWTRSMVQEFLPTPDALRQNPHRRAGRPMRLFREERVLRVESTPDFVLRRATVTARRRRSA
jgi:hypothetical protein